MKTGQFLTRDSAIAYLTSNRDFLRLYVDKRGNGRSLDDLGAGQARRYANRMYFEVSAGSDTGKWRDLGPLRGHIASENHAGRKNKAGFEHYIKPAAVKRGRFYTPNAEGQIVSQVRITRGERTAEREILEGSRFKTHGHTRQVAINVTGGKEGQYAQLFWKGGWNADSLLSMAGWKRRKNGNWYRPRDAIGLEDALKFYIDSLPYAHGGSSGFWGAIKLYEVYVYDEPIREVADPDSRWTVTEFAKHREQKRG